MSRGLRIKSEANFKSFVQITYLSPSSTPCNRLHCHAISYPRLGHHGRILRPFPHYWTLRFKTIWKNIQVVFLGRTVHAMVVFRHFHGGNDVFHGYSKLGNRHRSFQWSRWKLDVVGLFANGNANCFSVRPTLASFRRLNRC